MTFDLSGNSGKINSIFFLIQIENKQNKKYIARLTYLHCLMSFSDTHLEVLFTFRYLFKPMKIVETFPILCQT